MKVHMLRTLGTSDAQKFGVDKETCKKCKEGDEVDLSKESAEKLIEQRLAVLPKDADKEVFTATPPQPMRAVSTDPTKDKDKK